MKRIFLLIASVALSRGAEDPKQISMRFRALSLGEPVEQAAYQSEGKWVRFTIASDFLSPTQEYRGPSTLVFFQDAPRPDKVDARTPLRQELSVVLDEAHRQEALLLEAKQAAAEATAKAPEGKEGDAARREAGLILSLAEPAEEAARKARERAAELQSQIDRMPAVTSEDKPVGGKETKQPASGKPMLKKLGTVTAAEGESLLFLFQPGAKEARILKITDPTQSHPYGTLRFLNLGNAPLRLASPYASMMVTPRQPTLFTPNRDAYGYVGIEVREAGPSGRVLRTLRARPEPDARTTYLLLPEGDGITIKGITERAPRPGP